MNKEKLKLIGVLRTGGINVEKFSVLLTQILLIFSGISMNGIMNKGLIIIIHLVLNNQCNFLIG